MMKTISIRLKIKTPDFEAATLERECKNFFIGLDPNGESRITEFSIKEISKRQLK